MSSRRDRDRYSVYPSYETTLDNGEDPARWSDLFGTATNVVSGTHHITGAMSISMDKAAGNTKGYIIRPLDVRQGVDLDLYSASGQILTSVYLPDTTDVVSFDVGFSMSSGTENSVFYYTVVSGLAPGWNHVLNECNTYDEFNGCGIDWQSVKYLSVGLTYSSSGVTKSGILVDSVRVRIPPSTISFAPTVIGAATVTTSTVTTGPWQQPAADTLADVTNGTDGTYYYYVDMDTYRQVGFQLELDGGSGTVTVTLEGTLQDDGTAQASCTYQDITYDTFSLYNTITSDMWIDDSGKLAPYKYLRLKVVADTAGSNDADWTIYVKELY